ncbi:MAG: mannose-6-phosphate isomerase, partial [Micromonosporaceae bacterium]|nr:mannose-6-phosphate isomerase [Micromonosporaceae bacterium]
MRPFGGAWLSGHREVDEALLNDTDRLIEADPSGMLRALASAGAQVRESTALAAEANLAALADEGRPRAVVVAGVGTAARTCDLLETVAGPRCPVPVLAHRSAGVPGWV